MRNNVIIIRPTWVSTERRKKKAKLQFLQKSRKWLITIAICAVRALDTFWQSFMKISCFILSLWMFPIGCQNMALRWNLSDRLTIALARVHFSDISRYRLNRGYSENLSISRAVRLSIIESWTDAQSHLLRLARWLPAIELFPWNRRRVFGGFWNHGWCRKRESTRQTIQYYKARKLWDIFAVISSLTHSIPPLYVPCPKLNYWLAFNLSITSIIVRLSYSSCFFIFISPFEWTLWFFVVSAHRCVRLGYHHELLYGVESGRVRRLFESSTQQRWTLAAVYR